MRRSLPILALHLAVLAPGCASESEPLGVTKVRTRYDVSDSGSVIGHSLGVRPSACVLEQLEAMTPEELDSYRETLCDPDVHPGAMRCDGVEVIIDPDDPWGLMIDFEFEQPLGYDDEGYFALGPWPTPETSPCDPVVELMWEGPRYETPGAASRPTPPVKMRAGAKVYQLAPFDPPPG